MAAVLISTLLKTPLVAEALGAVTSNGNGRISKTKVGITGLMAIAPDWADLIPRAFSGDWPAIGQLAGIAVAYGLALWGRGTRA